LCNELFQASHREYVVDTNHLKRSRQDPCAYPVAGLRNAQFVFQSGLASLGEWDFRSDMKKVKVPALVLEGAGTHVPLDETQEWVKSLHGARLLLIPNAGHLIWADQPEAVISAMDEFFQGKWPAGAAAQSGGTSEAATLPQTRFLNPDGLNKPMGYTHVVVTEPRKLVYISGQVAWDTNGEIVGKGDLRVQVTKALENLKLALTAAGATMEDLIKVNYYVVNLKPDQVPIIREVRSKYFSAEHPPASTLVGVTALAREEFMVEIEAVAVMK
jgi:2-iminobutanoate/2-iminopropanoate deaminase